MPNTKSRSLQLEVNDAKLDVHQVEFQKVLDHRGVVLDSIIGALSHVGLARAYVQQGDFMRARAAYEDFFNLWMDADKDVPILIAAKSEYAKLH